MSQQIYFARGNHSLNAKKLKSHEKMWLAKRVQSGKVDIQIEAKRLNLDPKLNINRILVRV